MPRSCYHHVRAEHRLVADVYVRIVDESEPRVDVDMLSQVQVGASPVRLHWRLDPFSLLFRQEEVAYALLLYDFAQLLVAPAALGEASIRSRSRIAEGGF